MQYGNTLEKRPYTWANALWANISHYDIEIKLTHNDFKNFQCQYASGNML